MLRTFHSTHVDLRLVFAEERHVNFRAHTYRTDDVGIADLLDDIARAQALHHPGSRTVWELDQHGLRIEYAPDAPEGESDDPDAAPPGADDAADEGVTAPRRARGQNKATAASLPVTPPVPAGVTSTDPETTDARTPAVLTDTAQG